MIFVAGIAIGVVAAILLAVFDVFWPIGVAVVVAAIAVWWLGTWPEVIHYVQPLTIAIYFAIGFVWVFFKWTRLVERKLREARLYGYKPVAPKWADHSYDFTAYFFYWPIDIVAYVLSDLVRDAWRFVSTIVERSFDRYAEWRFGR